MLTWLAAGEVLLAALLVAGVLVLPADAHAESAAPLVFQRIGSEAGLSHNTVFAVAEDRRGFLWIGTVDGLDRWDGYEFVIYRHDPSDPGSLSNQAIRCLREDSHGALWVGTDEGVNRLDQRTGRFTRHALRASDGAPVRAVWALHEDGEGTLWAGTDHGLFRHDPARGRFEPHALAPPPAAHPASLDVFALRTDPSGMLWALRGSRHGAGTTLHPVAATGPPRDPIVLGPEWGWVSTFLIDRRGRFWLNGIPGVRTEGRLQPEVGARGLAPVEAETFLETRSGTIWMGGPRGLWRIDPSTGARVHHEFSPGGGWLPNTVRGLFEDHTGAVWIGTYVGVYRHDPESKPFRGWQHDRLDPKSLSSSVVSAVRSAGQGELWVGTFGGGLNLLDLATGTARRFRHLEGDRSSLADDAVWDVHAEEDGTTWVATQDGPCVLDAARRRFTRIELPLPPDPGPRPDLRVVRIVRGPGGRIWVAGFSGLYSVDLRTRAARRHPLNPEAEAGVYAVNSVLPLEGAVWAGSGILGLARLDPQTGAVKRYPLVTREGSLLQSEGIWTIHRDATGILWLGTGAGLSRFDPTRETFEHFFPHDGLPGALVYSILEDAGGRLWLGTNRGLTRFDPRGSGSARFRTYDLSDGVATLEFNRGAATAAEGAFFFGGMDGLVAFVPDQIRDDRHLPPVALTDVHSSRREGTIRHNAFGLERLLLTHHDSSFAFGFSALSYANPRRNRYAYRLEGFDADWVDAGPQRQARYTNVPAGDYVFRVRAANADGAWNEEGVALPVTIVPPPWQRWWFRTLAVVAAVGLLAAAYRARVSRLLEMERLRLRIASDLHDDLSSDLSAIAVVTDMLQRRVDLPPLDRGRLAELRDKAMQMAGALRDTVWYVQPEHDTMEAMVRRMRSVAADMLGETACTFDVQVGDGHGPVHMGARRDLFLVYKELIHNVARHARAGRVEVSLRATEGTVTLRVKDDGVGFDPGAAHDGEGLRSLRRRSQGLGARLEIRSRPGEGTETTVVADLARAREGRAGA